MGMQEYLLEKAKTTGLTLGLQKGIEKGRVALEKERARAKAAQLAKDIDSARRFKEMGIPAEDIAKGLGLSIEDIEKL